MCAVARGRRGGLLPDLVVEITQRRRGYFDRKRQEREDAEGNEPQGDGDFVYRAGCTLLMNPVTMEVRRVIRTPGTIADDDELDRMRRFLTEGGLESENAFDMARNALHAREPFAMLHRGPE